MRIPTYSPDRRITGHIVDGRFIPIPPAPEGDTLDELILDCLRTIESYVGKALNKLNPALRPDHGAASLELLEGLHSCGFQLGHGGVKSWIVNGNLRSVEQLTMALNEFVTMKQKAVRLRKIADWEFDRSAMKWMSQKFGAPFKPDPTQEELKAETQKRSEEIRRNNEDTERRNRELVAYEQELDKKSRIKDLIKKLASDFFTMDDLYLAGDNMPPEYHEVRKKREIFKKFNCDLITMLVNEGKTDAEIVEEMTEMNSVTRGKFRSHVDDAVKAGETRQFFSTMKDFHAFMQTIDYKKFVTKVSLGMDSRWVVTVSPVEKNDGTTLNAEVTCNAA